MGLLGKWLKKKEQDQLEATQNVEATVKPADSVKKVEPKKTAPATKKDSDSKEVAKEKTTATPKPIGSKASSLQEILVRPIVSEKAAASEAKGAYSFMVKTDANKVEIKKAIKAFYGVMPKKVRVMNVEGKKVRFGRQYGKRGGKKKAIVYLPKGQSINIHEGV